VSQEEIKIPECKNCLGVEICVSHRTPGDEYCLLFHKALQEEYTKKEEE
jgi:hypothetical protein